METASLDSKSSSSNSAQITTTDGSNGCFNCNICLESATDPVVTRCGHLYCWPCIYRWLQVQSSSGRSNQQWTCPVCKADISYASLVPLYGGGTSFSESEANQQQRGLGIPRRPPPSGLNAMSTSRNASTSHPGQQLRPNSVQSRQPQPQHRQYVTRLYRGSVATGSPYLGGLVVSSFMNPGIGMFGDMAFTRVFRSLNSHNFPYRFVVLYPPIGSSSPTATRQLMQIDKSLNRVFIFLLCCIILCLLLF